jgi:H+/gluconate symporter-like permease
MTTGVIAVGVLLALLVLVTGITPFFYVPIVAILLGALVVPPLLAMWRRTNAGSLGTTTSTEDASYEPVQEPVRRGE